MRPTEECIAALRLLHRDWKPIMLGLLDKIVLSYRLINFHDCLQQTKWRGSPSEQLRSHFAECSGSNTFQRWVERSREVLTVCSSTCNEVTYLNTIRCKVFDELTSPSNENLRTRALESMAVAPVEADSKFQRQYSNYLDQAFHG